MSTTTAGGRRFLTTFNGRPFQDPRPSYLETEQEAIDTATTLRCQYGGDYGYIDAGVPATCESNSPKNGSHCERVHGHDGRCWYTESLDGKRRYWERKS